ncbi:multidrug effflux MFS transporter [Sphingomonas sp. Root710]|uniref:multidrug effflux MFS transporter n=1 Tax=Sphingomonas sp. Root710 TaxID=1736594 RepID=UPI0006F79A00|nr:multidrug effflux MFS transporter [Sphingomonas sp. Root710]
MNQTSFSARRVAPLIIMLGMMSAFGAISINMYLPALPAIGRSLHTPTASVQLTVAAFMIGISSGQLFWGALSERVGRRLPLLIGFGLFVLSCCACAAAGSLSQLIVARLFQGLGACSGMAMARSIVSDRFEGTDAAMMFSWQHLIMGVAPVLAPIAGAAVLSLFGWRAIFWILAALGASLLAFIWLRLPESRTKETALLALSESRLAAYGALLRNHRVLIHLFAAALAAMPLMTWYSGASPLFQDSFGWSASESSWLFGIMGVLIVGATQFNRRLLRRYRPAQVIRSILALGAIACLCTVATVGAGLAGPPLIAAAMIFTVSLYGLVSANMQACALAEDRSRSGSMSALFGCGIYAGGGVVAWFVTLMPPAGGVSMLSLMAVELTAAWLLLRWMDARASTGAAVETPYPTAPAPKL